MRITVCLLLVSSFLLLAVLASPASSATLTPSLTVSPAAGPVGGTVSISGQGFPPSSRVELAWDSGAANWTISGNPPEVTDVTVTPRLVNLSATESDASGSFSARVRVPADYGGRHLIVTLGENGISLGGKAIFTLEPSFRVSPTSGPAGTPITVTATGLGYGLYSTNYHLLWDKKYAGYMTGLTTRGSTNFTLYASGSPGNHSIDIYQGYPGPAYLNPQQGPPSAETQSSYPPLIPFHAEFTVTLAPSSGDVALAGQLGLGSLTLVAVASLLVQFSASRGGSGRQKAAWRRVGVALIVVALVAGGAGLYLGYAPTLGYQPYHPEVTVVRPQIVLPQPSPTSGPSITVTPDLATVGTNVTVRGTGFPPDAELPILWSTREGSNLLGYQLVDIPMRNVTTDSAGSFSFGMTVPVDLGGVHYIAAANLTRSSNASLYIERSASVNATQGPPGTRITIKLLGVGWDYNTNIVAFDYDNSYVGYACGFSSQGNVTVTLVATGSPGIHTIDLYPSIWRGPDNTAAIFRYPLLTPQDHPELVPSFHFSFLMTGTPNQSGSSGGGIGSLLSAAGVALGVVFLVLQVALRDRRTPPQSGVGASMLSSP